MFERFKDKVVVIEGADGTGKDTITDILYKKLPSSFVIRFPDRSNNTGKVINDILTKKVPFPHPLAFQSLMLSNKIETFKILEEKTEINPKIYLCCRSYESAYIYGMLDGIPIYLSQQMNSVLPQSTVTFILYGKKYRVDNEHYEDTEKQKKISQYYIDFAKQFGWKLVNNMHDPEDIADAIIKHLDYMRLI